MQRHDPPSADPPLQSHPAIVAIMEALRIGPSAPPGTPGAPPAPPR